MTSNETAADPAAADGRVNVGRACQAAAERRDRYRVEAESIPQPEIAAALNSAAFHLDAALRQLEAEVAWHTATGLSVRSAGEVKISMLVLAHPLPEGRLAGRPLDTANLRLKAWAAEIAHGSARAARASNTHSHLLGQVTRAVADLENS